jgi:hypothetical protein
MSKDIVWASNAMINPAMLRSIRHSLADSGEENKKKTLAAAQGIKDGKSMGPEFFPAEIYVAKDANTNYEKLPALFYAYGYWVVSGAVAEVMRKFNLGGGNLYPTKVFRKDRKTPIGDSWFCLNFGNVKKAFVGQPESMDVSRFGLPTIDEWSAPTILKDGQLAVTADALAGPDIWIDPKLKNIFFVSDALAKALKDAGVAGPFGLKKCRII